MKGAKMGQLEKELALSIANKAIEKIKPAQVCSAYENLSSTMVRVPIYSLNKWACDLIFDFQKGIVILKQQIGIHVTEDMGGRIDILFDMSNPDFLEKLQENFTKFYNCQEM